MSPRMGLDLQKIVQTSIEIADEDGVHAVTMANLAKRLNIRSPSLYNHIEGLPALRNELALHGLRQLYSAMETNLSQSSLQNPVIALGKAYIRFARLHPGLYEATLHASDNQLPEIQKAGNKIIEITLKVLESYHLDKDTALHTVRGLRSILHGFVSLEQNNGFGITLDLDDSLDYILITFLKGIQ
ncbi:TetR/AcrR family transcriptional regulator [Aquibacillus rhizosphaerae]|uniref:WHG domain-containing protein n=1 Tax=Aquibacillus rhizosphaerae TaxID=3051431 RepID=A0ABT7L1P6_9BACI|nr:TetR/AcrR family transcriptional regulator [Aquibacillus sp. LR5S19]MDL4839776.1 WHG domain-containing protein [Aquibacillus sp. LR5S19]